MIDFPVSQSFQLEWQVSGENDSVLITIYRGLVAVMPLVLHYFTSEVTKINDFMTMTSIPGITPFQDYAALRTQANKSNYDSFRERLEEQAVGDDQYRNTLFSVRKVEEISKGLLLAFDTPRLKAVLSNRLSLLVPESPVASYLACDALCNRGETFSDGNQNSLDKLMEVHALQITKMREVLRGNIYKVLENDDLKKVLENQDVPSWMVHRGLDGEKSIWALQGEKCLGSKGFLKERENYRATFKTPSYSHSLYSPSEFGILKRRFRLLHDSNDNNAHSSSRVLAPPTNAPSSSGLGASAHEGVQNSSAILLGHPGNPPPQKKQKGKSKAVTSKLYSSPTYDPNVTKHLPRKALS